MSIEPGTQVGPYEITSMLGEGGMGVVYRARDARLQRDVAVKVLPDHLSNDPDRLGRFQREAQVLASLNHPNIAHIYGLEQSGRSSCIIMELVEGETLAERLKRGPLPIAESIEIAKQIADALEAAHERGIVHRDLKPANIKLTPSGSVKVLDFGLAKTVVKVDSETSLTSSPTMMSGSMTGIVMGTAAYMSPEQARGKAIDARTDIWAFGCVLYEMLTGRQAFAGETATDIIAKILEGPVNWNALPPQTPASLRIVLEETLRKEPKQRLQHVGDTRLFFNRSYADGFARQETIPARGGRKGSWVTMLLLIGFGAALVAAALYFLRAPAPAEKMVFEMPAPGLNGDLVISPDGQHVAYVATVDGKRAIWVRPIGSLSAQQLSGTDDAAGLFWSPDSHTLGFTGNQKLKKVDISGGPPIELSNAAVSGAPGTWSRDGIVLFQDLPGLASSIERVSSSGGEVKPVTPPSDGTYFLVAPQFLPDGKRFLYLSVTPQNVVESTMYMGRLDGKDQVRVMTVASGPGNSPPRYADPGYLLFVRNGTLLAQPFNGTLSGEPAPIAEGVGGFSTSTTGVLVYQKATAAAVGNSQQLQWFDRKGNRLGQSGEPASYASLELSPDGHRAAVTKGVGGTSDIWVVDLDRNVPSKMTFNSGNYWPVWAPDGRSIIFSGGGVIPSKIYQKSSTGAGAEELIFAGDGTEGITTMNWSAKSQHVIFTRIKLGTLQTADIWTLPMAGDKKPVPYIQSPYTKIQPQLSPYGRWMAYTTNESGSYQIVVQSFPDNRGGKSQVTANGGMEPRWRRDGRELYYLTLDGKLMALPVNTDNGFKPEKPSLLFQTPLTGLSFIPYPLRYDVTADGRFLMIVPIAAPAGATSPNPASTSTITAIVNWTAALRKK